MLVPDELIAASSDLRDGETSLWTAIVLPERMNDLMAQDAHDFTGWQKKFNTFDFSDLYGLDFKKISNVMFK